MWIKSSWNGTDPANLNIRMEMFSSYEISSIKTDDGLQDIDHRKLSTGDIVLDISKVTII